VIDAWDKCEDIARGVIILALHPAIAESVGPAKTVKEIWAEIKDKYGKPGSSGIYLEFKKMLGTEIPSNTNRSLALEILGNGFAKLKALGCEIPKKIQVLLYMSKLSSPDLDRIAQDVGATPNLDKVDIRELEWLIRMSWEQWSSKKAPQQATKVSAVKPSFREPQSSEQQGEKPKKKSLRGGKKKAAKTIQEEQPTASGSAQDGYAQLTSPAFTSQLASPAFFVACSLEQRISNILPIVPPAPSPTVFSYFFSMGHGWYEGDEVPWVMDHTTPYDRLYDP
jgi:hypothetical protein